METKPIKLNQVFRAPEYQPHSFSEFEMKDKLIDLKSKIRQKEPALNWQKVVSEIVNTSNKLLDINFEEILYGGWQKYSEVKKFLDSDEFNSDESFSLPLVQHTILSEHHPKIEIEFAGVYMGEIDFELLLVLKLSGIILSIKNKKIMGIKAGKCLAKGTFSCEGIILFSDETKEINF